MGARTFLVAAAALIALLAGADAAEAKRGQGVRIECSSLGDRYSYCKTHAIGTVRLERQLSKTPCRQYDTWGSDGDGSGVHGWPPGPRPAAATAGSDGPPAGAASVPLPRRESTSRMRCTARRVWNSTMPSGCLA